MAKKADSAQPLDPFDPAALRLDQTFTEGTAVKKLLTTVPVRKPARQDFFRVHPSEDYRFSPAGIIELKDERETYLVTPAIAAELMAEIAMSTIHTVINRQNVVHLWAVRLPSPDGRQSTWHTSAEQAAHLAQSSWIRMTANMALGAYEIFQAQAHIPEPEWPEHSFRDLLRIAFNGRLIDHLEHPLILKLQGKL